MVDRVRTRPCAFGKLRIVRVPKGVAKSLGLENYQTVAVGCEDSAGRVVEIPCVVLIDTRRANE